MKKSLVVLINSVLKVKDFVKTTESFDSDIDASQGRYTVPANSIMGLFSLNILDPVQVTIISDKEDEINKFNELMKEYLYLED